MPEADLGKVLISAKDDPHLNRLSRIDAFESEAQIADPDRPVGIYDPFQAETEDVLCGEEGGRDHELAEQTPLLFSGPLEADCGDFPGGRVDLAVVVTFQFGPEDLSALEVRGGQV